MNYKDNKEVYDDALTFTYDLAIESFANSEKVNVERLSRLMALAVMRSSYAPQLTLSMETLEELKKLGKIGYIQTDNDVYFNSIKSYLVFKVKTIINKFKTKKDGKRNKSISR